MTDFYTKYFPELTQRQLSKFNYLKELIAEWNEKINLISRNRERNIHIEHILHSLSIARFMQFEPGTKILDFGTGGGFPGLPLAIYFENVEFLLVDSIAKKVKVVKDIAERLHLENVRTGAARVEDVEEKFDFITCRAVGRIGKIIPWVQGKLSDRQQNASPNGYIFLKGGDLDSELKETNLGYERIPISRYFEEPFFETKEIVYLSPHL